MNKKLVSAPLRGLVESLKAVPRPIRSLMLALVGVVVMSTVALAIVTLILIPSDMNIVPGEVAAEAFLDPECTIPIPAVHWGDIGRGTHQQFDFYIKNTGVEPITASMTIPEDVSSFMTYTFTPASIPLNAGEVGHFVFTADVLPTAPLGLQSWNYRVDTP